MPSILILAAGPLCRNPRVLKEATTLGNAGYEVCVTAIENAERSEQYDRRLLQAAPFRRVALDRLSRRPLTRLTAFSERAHGWLARRAVRLGIESPHSLGPYSALRRLALRNPADLTIVHAELPFCVGVSLISTGRRVAADFEDWHSRDLLPESRSARPLRLLERYEGLLMRRSAYTSAPSDAMATALQGAYGGKKPIVIPNTFALQPAPPPLPRQRPPSFFWYSQTTGPGRGLEQFLKAWALTREPSRVCLLGDISEAYRDLLARLVPEDRRGRLAFLPIVSPEALPGLIATHDVGLALEPDTPESRYLTTTNKVFQYLNAGLAILATPTAGQREVISRVPGSGLLIDLGNPGALSAQLDALLADPGRLTAMGGAARDAAVRQFSWERTAPVLLEAVAGVLGAANSKR
jgi:glycosyltransferase involved in cell wall biosynthesis